MSTQDIIISSPDNSFPRFCHWVFPLRWQFSIYLLCAHSPLIAVNDGLKYLLLIKHFQLSAKIISQHSAVRFLWPSVVRNHLVQRDKMDATPTASPSWSCSSITIKLFVLPLLNLFLVLANPKTFQIAHTLLQHHVLQKKNKVYSAFQAGCFEELLRSCTSRSGSAFLLI